jgi:hypothetical protein
MNEICQAELPEDMRIERALPGVQPLAMADWLVVDDVYADQMQERLRLMSNRPDDVRAQREGSQIAIDEALDLVLAQLALITGFDVRDDSVLCPDGRCVSLYGDALLILGALIQEDICILQKPADADEHFLTAAILCFPSHWTLSEKIGHPMGRIHAPVAEYDENIRKRVQRLCDGVRPGRPLWRFNHGQAGAELFQPRSELDPPFRKIEAEHRFQRAERQSLIRLSKSDAILFSIHTYVVAL